jgi:two-component system, NtrC family, response regulator HydG
MANILLVEDDLTFSQILQGFLQKYEHRIDAVADVKSSLKLLGQKQYDLLLLDYRLPDGNGLEILVKVREQGINSPVIIMTSFNDVRTAVKSIRAGAFDYITKPVNPDELFIVVNNALSRDETKIITAQPIKDDFIKGTSRDADKLHEYIMIVAPTVMAVLIQGESGTGKEYAARLIHQQSKRAGKPFVAVDCGALSRELAASELFGHVKGAFTGAATDKKGLFETARGGTLFLDEVTNLGYEVQVKLLRALQERVIQPLGSTRQIPVDVRLITATNENLSDNVSSGNFRLDLYHRINEFKIQLPPLRERGEDLDRFIEHFIRRSNLEMGRSVQGISVEARQILAQYDWPGNLRELKNIIRRMVLLTRSATAGIESLPDEMMLSLTHPQGPKTTDLKWLNEVNEKELIQTTLQKVKYNKSKAAKLLNIDRKTLYSKIEHYGIDT